MSEKTCGTCKSFTEHSLGITGQCEKYKIRRVDARGGGNETPTLRLSDETPKNDWCWEAREPEKSELVIPAESVGSMSM